MNIWRRRETATFRAGFFSDFAQTIPREALGENQPTYEIRDPENTAIATGSGVADPQAGFYTVDFAIPDDAPLGPLGQNWRIDWNFVDVGGNNHTYSEEFEVRETPSEQSAVEKRHGYLVYQGKQAILQNRRSRAPDAITVEVSIPGQTTLVETDRQALVPSQPPEELVDGSVRVYRDTITSANLQEDTTYVVMWEITETPTSLPTQETEVLHVLSRTWIPYMHAFDVVINKIRARATDLQKATDYEMFNAIKHGLAIVNGWHPNTVTYNINNFPHQLLGHFVILAAQFWWLNSLYQAEGLLSFDFSGQTVSLTYDHLGWIEASMQRAMDFMNNELSKQKHAIVKRSLPAALVANRPVRYGNCRDHLIYRISASSNPGTVLDLLVGFGLI